MTNVRFSCDSTYVISTGGADHAIFQWRFIPENSANALDEVVSGVGEHTESNDEASDSDLSDVEPVDSDIEQVRNILILFFILSSFKEVALQHTPIFKGNSDEKR